MKKKENDTIYLDALLREAAAAETEALRLAELLPPIYAAAARPAAPARPRRMRRSLMAAVVLAAVLAAAVPAFAQTVVVEGKRYITFTDAVEIEGTVYTLDTAAPDTTPLVRLPDSAEYIRPRPAAPEPAQALPAVYVYAPDAEMPPERNPAFVPREDGEPASQEPVAVFPVVGDLMVREGPDVEYEAVSILHSGQIVTKVGHAGNWAILEWEGGFAYAYDAYLYELPAERDAYAPIPLRATEPVNVRALPTSRDESAVLCELQTGEEVLSTGRIGNWMQIEWEGGHAYVFAQYLAPGGEYSEPTYTKH